MLLEYSSRDHAANYCLLKWLSADCVMILVIFKEQEEVALNLEVDLKKYTNKGHFMSFTFPDLLNEIKQRLL